MTLDPLEISQLLGHHYAEWTQDPLIYGLLGLDSNGTWRLKGHPIRHDRFTDYANSHYHADPQGRWYLQNGPQKLFVDLAYTPWVLHLDQAASLNTHTNRLIQWVKTVWLDENGIMIFDTEHGPGILREDTLLAILEKLCDHKGKRMHDNPLDPGLVKHGRPSKPQLYLKWQGHLLPVGWIHSKAVSYKFQFVDKPGAFTFA